MTDTEKIQKKLSKKVSGGKYGTKRNWLSRCPKKDGKPINCNMGKLY